MTGPNLKAEAWALYDELVARASTSEFTNPWVRTSTGDMTYQPDFDTLSALLGVPRLLGASSQSGVPALALDAWVAYELRRAGFEPDLVWPRAHAPRILPSTMVAMIDGATSKQRKVLRDMLASGKTYGGETGASANILGKNYVKQVDVVMSAWNTGPEIMISTKRMDSSFGKNAANRVEESYGDAKNLRSRHPQAALGFVYSLRSTAFTGAAATAAWIVDLLGKLGREDDAYDAVALLVPEWPDATAPADEGDDGSDNPLIAAGIELSDETPGDQMPLGLAQSDLENLLDALQPIALRPDLVPDQLSAGTFFATMVNRVLNNCPITFHHEARRRRGQTWLA